MYKHFDVGFANLLLLPPPPLPPPTPTPPLPLPSLHCPALYCRSLKVTGTDAQISAATPYITARIAVHVLQHPETAQLLTVGPGSAAGAAAAATGAGAGAGFAAQVI